VSARTPWRQAGHFWGSTPAERRAAFPCDSQLPDFSEELFRAVTVQAPAPILFRWLCQLRVAPYSYDWLDNLGRRSPRMLTPGAERLEVGQRIMGIFDLVGFEAGRQLTIRLRKPGIFPPLAGTYLVAPLSDAACRLVVKLVVRPRPGLWDRVGGVVFPWLDLVMMRRQLLNLKQLAEGDAHAPSESR
jgi:hypothetical protein